MHTPDPEDRKALQVWADELAQAGDPRGEYVQLCLVENPTAAQADRRTKLEKEKKGELVGPARPFLRTWEFDRATGLVHTAACEAPKLVEGFAHIAALHTRLTLEVSSLRTKAKETIAKLVKLPLGKIYFLRLESNALSDKSILALAPALGEVRNLSLAVNDVTADGLRQLGPFVKQLEFLCLGTSTRDTDPKAVANAWADAVCETPGYAGLKTIFFFRGGKPDDAHVERLKKLPRMKTVQLSEYPPYDAKTIDAFKA